MSATMVLQWREKVAYIFLKLVMVLSEHRFFVLVLHPFLTVY